MPPTKPTPKCDRHAEMESDNIRHDMRIKELEETVAKIKTTLGGNGKAGVESAIQTLQIKEDMREKWDNRTWVILSGLLVSVCVLLLKNYIF